MQGSSQMLTFVGWAVCKAMPPAGSRDMQLQECCCRLGGSCPQRPGVMLPSAGRTLSAASPPAPAAAATAAALWGLSMLCLQVIHLAL